MSSLAVLVLFVGMAAGGAILAARQPPAAPAAPAPRQERPPQQQEGAADAQTQRFRTEANFVRVDAYPTQDGKPVQDLRADEFEILENGVRQQIQAFEHVVVGPAGPQLVRTEPNSVRGGEQMAANPRNRVFVFFLDVPHVSVESSHHIKEPLLRLMDRILGPDDLVAVMTPEMSATQLTFGRKTAVLADMLRDRWYWGARHSAYPPDNREREYERCYPPNTGDLQQGITVPLVVRKMIARRRERLVLEAAHDLVRYLGTIREERKAILVVSEGWLLHRPDPSMTELRRDPVTGQYEPIPGKPPIGVDEFGKLRIDPPRRGVDEAQPSQTTCDTDRMHLANIDNEEYFRELLDAANRNNATFYPIDPRGLAALDYPMGLERPPHLAVDQLHLRTRLQNLVTLAEDTDGMAVVNSNDLDRGLRRIADDLTSYYLLGYYSTNTKLDGGYRKLTVRVRRPGVDIRARRGYRAATAAEVNASRSAAAVAVPDTVKTATAALSMLERIRPEQRFNVHAVAARDTAGGAVTALWVAGEVVGSAREYAAGGTATIEVSGAATASASAPIKPGERAFLVKIPVSAASGQLEIRVRLSAAGASEPLSDVGRLAVDAPAPQPLLFRGGLSTGNRVQPAASFQFSRTDRLHVELPVAAGTRPGTARLLDRNAQPLQLPVQAGERTSDDGQRWMTADATLSALGAGDYVLELAYVAGTTEQKVLTGIRVTR